jgi:hypothetical protein
MTLGESGLQTNNTYERDYVMPHLRRTNGQLLLWPVSYKEDQAKVLGLTDYCGDLCRAICDAAIRDKGLAGLVGAYKNQ